MTRSNRTTRDAGGRLLRFGPELRGWAGAALPFLLLGVLLLTVLLIPDMPGLSVALIVVAVLTAPSGRARRTPAPMARLAPVRSVVGTEPTAVRAVARAA